MEPIRLIGQTHTLPRSQAPQANIIDQTAKEILVLEDHIKSQTVEIPDGVRAVLERYSQEPVSQELVHKVLDQLKEEVEEAPVSKRRREDTESDNESDMNIEQEEQTTNKALENQEEKPEIAQKTAPIKKRKGRKSTTLTIGRKRNAAKEATRITKPRIEEETPSEAVATPAPKSSDETTPPPVILPEPTTVPGPLEPQKKPPQQPLGTLFLKEELDQEIPLPIPTQPSTTPAISPPPTRRSRILDRFDAASPILGSVDQETRPQKILDPIAHATTDLLHELIHLKRDLIETKLALKAGKPWDEAATDLIKQKFPKESFETDEIDDTLTKIRTEIFTHLQTLLSVSQEREEGLRQKERAQETSRLQQLKGYSVRLFRTHLPRMAKLARKTADKTLTSVAKIVLHPKPSLVSHALRQIVPPHIRFVASCGAVAYAVGKSTFYSGSTAGSNELLTLATTALAGLLETTLADNALYATSCAFVALTCATAAYFKYNPNSEQIQLVDKLHRLDNELKAATTDKQSTSITKKIINEIRLLQESIAQQEKNPVYKTAFKQTVRALSDLVVQHQATAARENFENAQQSDRFKKVKEGHGLANAGIGLLIDIGTKTAIGELPSINMPRDVLIKSAKALASMTVNAIKEPIETDIKNAALNTILGRQTELSTFGKIVEKLCHLATQYL